MRTKNRHQQRGCTATRPAEKTFSTFGRVAFRGRHLTRVFAVLKHVFYSKVFRKITSAFQHVPNPSYCQIVNSFNVCTIHVLSAWKMLAKWSILQYGVLVVKALRLWNGHLHPQIRLSPCRGAQHRTTMSSQRSSDRTARKTHPSGAIDLLLPR
jgi:hypothetical protein